jgi:CubicO group peptidase (beta-lactamase class C family)
MDLFNSNRFASRVKGLLSKHHVPGLAAAIVQGDTVVTAAYGKASINPPRDCTPETLFDAASTSKSVTAASVSLLVKESRKYRGIQWDTPVATLLPEDFVLPNQAETASVTVEDILGHRSGMAP